MSDTPATSTPTASVRSITPDEIKVKLRKMKTVPGKVKAAIYGGCKDPGAAMQFNSDVTVYGMFEALLYVEGYEKDGMFAPGTAVAAIKTFIK